MAIDVAAANATELPREGNARMKLSVHASQTSEDLYKQMGIWLWFIKYAPVRIGERYLSSTLWKNLEPGSAPSRENAYIIRLLDVIENVLLVLLVLVLGFKCHSYPQKNIAPMVMTLQV